MQILKPGLKYNRKWWARSRANRLWYNLWVNCRERARKKNIECTITLDDIPIPEVCPILGIELVSGFETGRDNSPSVDRIDLSKGYIPQNVQVISTLANRMKTNATLEQCVLLGRWAQDKISSND